MAIEHLPPQYSKSNLENWMELNYQRAINFYKARFDGFVKNLEKDLNVNAENLLQSINADIQKKWDNNIRGKFWTMVSQIRKGENISGQISTLQNSDVFEERFLGNMIMEFLTQYKANPKSSPAAIFGNNYENFVNAVIVNTVWGGANFTAQEIDTLVNEVANHISVTGNKKSSSVAVSGSAYIRPDIIWSLNNPADFQKRGEVLYANNMSVELQSSINLDETATTELLNLAEQYNIAGLYGFSIKSWFNSNRKAFMHSTPLKDELSNTFTQVDSNGIRHNWQNDYTTAYMLWKVSTHIIDFIGPTDIGLITGRQFESFDIWLNNHLFYMEVQLNNIRDNKNSYSARPTISNAAVYILDFIHGSQNIKTKLSRADKTGNRYLRIVAKHQ